MKVIGLGRACFFACVVLNAANAKAFEVNSPAEVIGYQFGSLSCQSLDDPDQRHACEAGSFSNGNGCYGLGATSMRQRCADFKRPDTFYPMTPKIRLDLEKFKSIHEDN